MKTNRLKFITIASGLKYALEYSRVYNTSQIHLLNNVVYKMRTQMHYSKPLEEPELKFKSILKSLNTYICLSGNFKKNMALKNLVLPTHSSSVHYIVEQA